MEWVGCFWHLLGLINILRIIYIYRQGGFPRVNILRFTLAGELVQSARLLIWGFLTLRVRRDFFGTELHHLDINYGLILTQLD